MIKPTTTSPRIEFIDVLRGFTLLGIGLIHMIEQYYAGPHPNAHRNFAVKFLGDDIASGVINFLVAGKFFMIFSFLFGLSFFLQLKNSDGSIKFSAKFLWRLIILFAIGMVHHLHYRGDILTIYAILGVVLLLTFKLPDKAILFLGLFLMLNGPTVIVRTIELIQYNPATAPADPWAAFNGNDADNLKYFDTLKSGSYLEILKANFNEFDFKMNFQVLSGRLYITAGLFLMGLFAGRKSVFNNMANKIPVLKKGMKWGLFVMLGCVVTIASVFGIFNALGINPSPPVQALVGGGLFDIFNTAQALLYCSFLAWLFQKPKWQQRFMVFYHVGKMGLTTYLLQAVFGTIILFSYGLALLGDIGALACIALSLAFFMAQVIFSKWWFSKFMYGPLEWLWRSATMLKFQPMKI